MAAQREWYEKDYYKVLGVSDDAPAKDITKAYRKLARANHPDTHPGDDAAEERFKEISAAYDVLGDEVKRKEYDEVRKLGPIGGFQPGGPGQGGFNFNVGSEGLGDLLGQMFGRGRRGGGPSAAAGPQRGADVEATLTLDFADAAQGITTTLHLTSDAQCSTCHGSGAKPGTQPVVCSNCGGRGVIDDNQGLFSFSSPCRVCGGRGVIVTRTGRRFFHDAELEAAALHRVDTAMETSGLWMELNTDWVLWDAEILPWSMKAGSLLRDQYAAVGAAAIAGLDAASAALEAARARGVDVDRLASATTQRLDDARLYRAAYNRYVAPFAGIDDLRVAPFHLLASEGAVHDDKDHLWHMSQAHRLAGADPSLIVATGHRRVDLGDPAQVAEAIAWWEALTAAGGEGMVVKPLDFVTRGGRGLLQPAIKCRGREYLRIIYGPDYDQPENLLRLKKRGLGQKRSMALREFALGLEALHRFVEHAPLTRVHQCVFGVLAMESEPVDPRL